MSTKYQCPTTIDELLKQFDTVRDLVQKMMTQRQFDKCKDYLAVITAKDDDPTKLDQATEFLGNMQNYLETLM